MCLESCPANREFRASEVDNAGQATASLRTREPSLESYSTGGVAVACSNLIRSKISSRCTATVFGAAIPTRTWLPFIPRTVTVTSSPTLRDSPTRRVRMSMATAVELLLCLTETLVRYAQESHTPRRNRSKDLFPRSGGFALAIGDCGEIFFARSLLQRPLARISSCPGSAKQPPGNRPSPVRTPGSFRDSRHYPSAKGGPSMDLTSVGRCNTWHQSIVPTVNPGDELKMATGCCSSLPISHRCET